MADLSDVETALVDLISSVIYPNGTLQTSAIGAQCRIYRGWPNATALNADLAAGVANITVFPEQGGRNTTRYPRDWSQPAFVAPALTVTTAEPVVTFAGTCAAGQIAGIRTDAGAWAYAVQATDTPATVAASLAALIPGASVSGAAVTVAPSAGILGRIAATATALREVRRQVQSIRITFWCPTPALRDAAASLVDAALGGTDWLALSDGTAGRLIYRWNFTNDVPQKDALWRRDLRYDVEYPTTQQQTFTQMLFGGGHVEDMAPNVLKDFGDLKS